MKFSIATKDITPQKPAFLTGFAARTKPSEGVLDPVFVRTLLLQDSNDNTLLIITVDVTAGDDNFCNGIKNSLNEKFGLEHHQVLINYSHTHHSVKLQGPENLGPRYRLYAMSQKGWAQDKSELDYADDDAYYQFVHDSIMQMVRDGLANMHEGNLYLAKGQSGFAVSRRFITPDGRAEWRPNHKADVDRDLFVLKITDTQDEIKAIVPTYGCHPTSMGPENNLFSNDYIGEMTKIIEQKYTGAKVLFLQGCAGDLKPFSSAASHRFVKCDQAEMQEGGRLFAKDIKSVLEAEHFEKVDCHFASALRIPEMPVEYKPLQFWKDVLESDQPEYRKRNARRHIKEIENNESHTPYHQYIQVLQLAKDTHIVALRDEIPTAYGLILKEKLGNGKLITMAYSNSIMTYIPTRAMIESGQGGYEVETPVSTLGGQFKPEIEDVIINGAKEALEECRQA